MQREKQKIYIRCRKPGMVQEFISAQGVSPKSERFWKTHLKLGKLEEKKRVFGSRSGQNNMKVFGIKIFC